jgi:hypothetical protein
MVSVQVELPSPQEYIFWFLFNIGLWGALSCTFVAACYFVAFIKMRVSNRIAAVGANLALYAFSMCVLFAIANVIRGLNVSHTQQPGIGNLGFFLGIILPLAANGLLHRNSLRLWWRGQRGNDA